MADRKRVRTVEKDPRGDGWIARSPFDGRELCQPGDRWNCRESARCVVWEEIHLSAEGKRRRAAASRAKGV